jgi:hypothetical protein
MLVHIYLLTPVALQMVDAPVHLQYLLLRIARPLEMAIHVRSDREVVAPPPLGGHQARDLFQYLVAPVRPLLPVQREPGTVETPEEVRVTAEEAGVGALDEAEFAAVGRVVVPETLVTPEVRQTGVLAHTRPSSNDQHLRLSEETRGSLDCG